jgi:hypothetical protein
MGVVSVWSINEMASHLVSDYELNMNLGGKFKLMMNYTDNLFDYENVVDLNFMTDVTSSIEIEFDPNDP